MKSKPLLCLLVMSVAIGMSTGIGAAPAPQTAGAWVNATGNLANMASECGNLTRLSAVPGSDTVIAGVAQKGLWANNSGTTWSHLGSGAGSDAITHRPSWIVYDPLNPAVFWESGIYGNTFGVYKTTDGGVTFHSLGLFHNDYVSVDFTDPNRQTLLAGGHEQSQRVWRSTDGGQTWPTNVGATIPPNTRFSTDPLIINSQTYVVNLSGWASGTAGIFRTTNGGASWQPVSALGPNDGPPLVTTNGTIYWSTGGGYQRSMDSGATWTQVGNNLHQVTPAEGPGGQIVSASGANLVISADNGATWTPFGPSLPYTPAGVIYSTSRKAFFIWHWDCGGVVLPDAIMRLDVDPGLPVPGAPTGLRILP